MPTEAPNKIIFPGYPKVCQCGETMPTLHKVVIKSHMKVSCRKCGSAWTYYPGFGWAGDAESRHSE